MKKPKFPSNKEKGNFKPDGGTKKGKGGIECSFCQRKGHVAEDCFRRGKEAQSALKAIVSSILTKNNATINPPRVPILPVPAIMGSIQQSTQESDENFPIDLNSLSYLSTLYSNKD